MLSADDTRKLQEMVGESANKLKSFNLKGVCNPVIANEAAFEGSCANTTAILSTLCEFDVNTEDFKLGPIKHVGNRLLSQAVSTEDYCRYARKNPSTHKLLYWLFDLKCRFEAALARVAEDEDLIDAANPKNGNACAKDVDCTILREAYSILEEGLATFSSMCTGVKPVETTLLYTNSPYSPESIAAGAARKRTADTPATPSEEGGPKKKHKGGEGSPTKPERFKGAIKVKKPSDAITLPADYPEVKGYDTLCPVSLRHNRKTKICNKPGCNKWHESDPTKWPKPVIDSLKRHMKANSNKYEWNYDVMKPSLLGMQYVKDPDTEVPNP